MLANHGPSSGIWLVTFKKNAGERHVPPQALVEAALVFGWIDCLPPALDAQRTMRLLTPRRPGSAWSKVNKSLIEALTARGEMHVAGLARVAAAKSDSSWNKLDEVETLSIPEDLNQALDRDPQARRNFPARPLSTRRAIPFEVIGDEVLVGAVRDQREEDNQR